jgi:hypothetical protein
MTFNIDNSNPEKTAINFTTIAISTKPLVQFLQIVTLSIPEDEQDKLYRKVWFRTTVNICKLAQLQSNFLVKAFMSSFANPTTSEFR